MCAIEIDRQYTLDHFPIGDVAETKYQYRYYFVSHRSINRGWNVRLLKERRRGGGAYSNVVQSGLAIIACKKGRGCGVLIIHI